MTSCGALPIITVCAVSLGATTSPLKVNLIRSFAGPKSKVKAKAEAWLAQHG